MNKDDIIFKIGTIRRDANLSARALSTRIDLNEGYILERIKALPDEKKDALLTFLK